MADVKTTKQSEQKPESNVKTLKVKALADGRLMRLTNGKKLNFAKAGDVKEVDAALVTKYTTTNADGETIIKPGTSESFRIV